MRVLRNYLPNSARRMVTIGDTPTRVRQISLPTTVIGQTISFRCEVEVLRGEMPEASAIVYNSTKNQSETTVRVPVIRGVWKVEGLIVPDTTDNLMLYLYNNQAGGSLGIDVARWNAHLAIGEKASDIWVPAEADLTPEQIETLPPYGEYKEIKSF